MNTEPKIVFMGTPEFGAIILEKLIKSGHKPFLVIAGQDKLVGRKQTLTPPPVKITAQNYNIPVVQPEKIINHKSEILNLKPDLIIVAAYGHILPKEILDIPQYGCLNVHPSLLPKYRGPSPIQYAILNGDEKTGVTIMRMTEKLDVGPILAQEEITVSEKENSQTLHDKLVKMGAELLIQALPKLFAGTITQQPQDDSKATYTKILTKDDGKIDWRKPAKEIERQIRALNPEPGTFTEYKGKNLKILEADVLPIQNDKQIGEVFLAKDRKLTVRTGQNCLILRKLQLEGGKPISSQDFLMGHRDFIGNILK
jgi:methionyl-tRNA formyltransferase